jgi:arabinofuranosyltransferase
MRSRSYLLVIIGFAIFIILVYPLRDTLVDDTYIHLVYARNLAETGELSFNRGDPTYGATSPLWVGLLAILYGAGVDLIAGCRMLSWLSALCSIALVYRLARRLDCDSFAALCAALVMSAEAWFLRWTAVGMETSFALFVTLLALDRAFSADSGPRNSILFGLFLFAAVLARPEALLLVPLALLALLVTRWFGGWNGILWLAVLAVLLAGWFVVIERHTGTFFPLTAGAKQGRPVLSAALFGRALVPIKIIGATLALPVFALIAGLLVGARRGSPLCCFAGDDRKRHGALLLLLWAVGLPTVYVLLDFQVLSRYLLPVTPAIVVLAFSSIEKISDRLRTSMRMRRSMIALFATAAIVQNVFFYSIVVVPPTRAFSRGLTEVIGGMGKWLALNTAPDAVVATPDIGAVGYYSERRVLDLGGLVTPEINDMRQSIDVVRIIDEGLYLRFDPDFLVDRSTIPMRFADRTIEGVRFIPVMEGWVENLGIRQPDPVCYVLYCLERVDR